MERERERAVCRVVSDCLWGNQEPHSWLAFAACMREVRSELVFVWEPLSYRRVTQQKPQLYAGACSASGC